jgi:hypothetical protein
MDNHTELLSKRVRNLSYKFDQANMAYVDKPSTINKYIVEYYRQKLHRAMDREKKLQR